MRIDADIDIEDIVNEFSLDDILDEYDDDDIVKALEKRRFSGCTASCKSIKTALQDIAATRISYNLTNDRESVRQAINEIIDDLFL